MARQLFRRSWFEFPINNFLPRCYLFLLDVMFCHMFNDNINPVVRLRLSMCLCLCVLAVYNKAQAQIISNREFKLWSFLQGTESRVATFHAETCVMSHQSLLCVCVRARVRACVHYFRMHRLFISLTVVSNNI